MKGWPWAVGLSGAGLLLLSAGGAPAATDGPSSALRGTVVHVDDGDTIEVRIGDRVERVRYVGIDAPEIAHPGRLGRPARGGAPGGTAAARVNAALVAGRAVTLELDVERRDRYGRLLAYVWVGGTMINAELVARGYARAFPIPPNVRYARHFAALDAQARAARRGLWATGARASDETSRPSARVHCARHGAPVSYDQRRGGVGRGRAPACRELESDAEGAVAPPVRRIGGPWLGVPSHKGHVWRSTRTSRSTPSTGCGRVSSSCPESRRWCACPSTSTAPISAAASGPPR